MAENSSRFYHQIEAPQKRRITSSCRHHFKASSSLHRQTATRGPRPHTVNVGGIDAIHRRQIVVLPPAVRYTRRRQVRESLLKRDEISFRLAATRRRGGRSNFSTV
jgi:hypothetical protein